MYCGSEHLPILSVFEPYNYQWHHIYLDNCCKVIRTATTLTKFDFSICGTIRKNRADSLKNIKLAIGETSFLRKNDVLVQVRRPKKTNAYMIFRIRSTVTKDSNRVNHLSGNFIQNQNTLF